MLVLGIVIWHITLDLTLEIENFSEFKQPLKVADIVIKARDTSDRTKLFFCGWEKFLLFFLEYLIPSRLLGRQASETAKSKPRL